MRFLVSYYLMFNEDVSSFLRTIQQCIPMLFTIIIAHIMSLYGFTSIRFIWITLFTIIVHVLSFKLLIYPRDHSLFDTCSISVLTYFCRCFSTIRQPLLCSFKLFSDHFFMASTPPCLVLPSCVHPI